MKSTITTPTQPAQHTPGALLAAKYGAELIRTVENEIANQDLQTPLTPMQRLEVREKAERDLAALIDRETSAPEMLAACKFLLEAVRETGEQYPNLETETWNSVRYARAAIAKAERP